MNREVLPIDEMLPLIVEHLFARGVIVLKAAPGAGKTTRVPPAMLDGGLADLPGRSGVGQIVVLQPRRVAARAAATRISEERGTELGDQIGYQVRFEKRATRNTRILVCTEGLFLRRLQDDPFLESTAAVVFDEFHERSVDSDLALALVRQIRQEIRPDLRIVVMSATLDCAPIARYLGDCPALECPGRLHPVKIEYVQHYTKASTEQLVFDGVKSALSKSSGDVLAFLPGVGEIRQVQSLLQEVSSAQDLAIMPLYGDLPLEEQQRVLKQSPRRKVVLATNVAETSLTIDGITTVVDSGLVRINRLDPQLGLNRLEVTRVSRASAEQRAGRAGRTGPGMCLRLWSEKEQQMFREFELPEIARVELSECLLQLIAWGEQNVRAFPWFEAPPAAVLDRAMQLLQRLDALDGNERITEQGKRMATLPLQPRLARMLLEGQRLGHARQAALCAALLCERDPFKRTGQFQARHHSDSDVVDRVSAIEDFTDKGFRESIVGELAGPPTKQVIRASEQLMRLISGTKSESASPGAAHSAETIMRALMVAFPDRVCKRREPRSKRAVMVGGRGVRLGEESAVAEVELFVAVEITDTGQAESIVRQASRVDRSWLPQSQIVTKIDVGYDDSREKVMALKRTRFCDLIVEELPVQMPPDLNSAAVLAEAVAARFDLTCLVDDDSKSYQARIQCLREWLPHLELPDLGTNPWHDLLLDWCTGCTSVNELRSTSLVPVLQTRLSQQQISEIDRLAPERFLLPNGKRVKLLYEAGKQPILAVRIQELFGVRDTPRIAEGAVPLLLHLLAPNYRVQQITPDLASFWKNTYSDVKKELKRRYPKHSWPDDPLTFKPEPKPREK